MGAGGLPNTSYRQMIAELSDDLIASPPASVQQAAERWMNIFWSPYSIQLSAEIAAFKSLQAKPLRTPEENQQFTDMFRDLFVGFCLGGHVASNRRPEAYGIVFGPDLNDPLCPSRYSGISRYSGAFRT